MKIGSGWTNYTDDGKEYVSIAIDDAIREILPQLKNISIGLTRLPLSEAKSENSPDWAVTIAKKKEAKKTNDNEQGNSAA